MRAVVQRCRERSVTVDGALVGACGRGLLVLVGVRHEDTSETAVRLAGKIARLRIFENDEGRFDRSLLDIAGEALVVSQFTLLGGHDEREPPELHGCGDARRGRAARRPPRCRAGRARRANGDRPLRRAHAGRARERRPGDDRPRRLTGHDSCLASAGHPLSAASRAQRGLAEARHEQQALARPRAETAEAEGAILRTPHFTCRAKWARVAPIRVERGRIGMATGMYERERELTAAITPTVESALPGCRGACRRDHGQGALLRLRRPPRGVDFALCERVTRLLDAYRADWAIDVSSPGPERPLRRPEHFRRAVGGPSSSRRRGRRRSAAPCSPPTTRPSRSRRTGPPSRSRSARSSGAT